MYKRLVGLALVLACSCGGQDAYQTGDEQDVTDGTMSCKGTPTACSEQSACGGPGCRTMGVCSGPERHCYDATIYGQDLCQGSYVGCVWYADSCVGNAVQCSGFSIELACNLQDHCSWQADGACGGNATPCEQLDESDCSLQPGCGWR